MEPGQKQKQIIGRHAQVAFLDNDTRSVPAKVDTGADSSSVWASELSIDEQGRLHFVLFARGSRYYTGKKITKEHYRVKVVRSSNGHEQVRYSVKLRVNIEERRFLATFTLADRSQNIFPVLIGTRLLRNKFVVDVSKGVIRDEQKVRSNQLTDLARRDPQEFFRQYYMTQDTKEL